MEPAITEIVVVIIENCVKNMTDVCKTMNVILIRCLN